MGVSAPAAARAAMIALVPVFANADDTPPPKPVAPTVSHPPSHAGDVRPGALMPGFETLADGSTRLFLELSKPVAYTTRTAPGVITYVLKGVRVKRRNNQNPLVTVHFNTPVTSARLVPHGHDTWFVLAMRANLQPAVSIDAAKDGTAIMHIDFPKGDYLRSGAAPAAAPHDTPPSTPPSTL
jgi:hypothetical protein